MIHRATHPDLDVDGCYACKLASIAIAASATPSRGGGQHAADTNAREKRWHRDHDAYRRLVRGGLEPKVLDGCAELETRASTEREVLHGLGAPKILDEIPKSAA